MHQHRNEEIISWVPDGMMRHDDREGNELVTVAGHPIVMNAGSGFWHAEEPLAENPPLWMLQLFVRPHSLDLEPGIQYEPIPDPAPSCWRLLFGPEDSDAPLFVCNRITDFDCRLGAGRTVKLPSRPGWDTYCYVFESGVTVDDGAAGLGQTESVRVAGNAEVELTATEDTVLVASCIDPDESLTRRTGTHLRVVVSLS